MALNMADLDAGRSTLELLVEMLTAVHPSGPPPSGPELELMSQLAEECRQLQPKITDTVQATSDEHVLRDALALNDSLQAHLARYDSLVKSSAQPKTPAWVGRFRPTASASPASSTFSNPSHSAVSGQEHYGRGSKNSYEDGSTTIIRQSSGALSSPASSYPSSPRSSNSAPISSLQNPAQPLKSSSSSSKPPAVRLAPPAGWHPKNSSSISSPTPTSFAPLTSPSEHAKPVTPSISSSSRPFNRLPPSTAARTASIDQLARQVASLPPISFDNEPSSSSLLSSAQSTQNVPLPSPNHQHENQSGQWGSLPSSKANSPPPAPPPLSEALDKKPSSWQDMLEASLGPTNAAPLALPAPTIPSPLSLPSNLPHDFHQPQPGQYPSQSFPPQLQPWNSVPPETLNHNVYPPPGTPQPSAQFTPSMQAPAPGTNANFQLGPTAQEFPAQSPNYPPPHFQQFYHPPLPQNQGQYHLMNNSHNFAHYPPPPGSVYEASSMPNLQQFPFPSFQAQGQGGHVHNAPSPHAPLLSPSNNPLQPQVPGMVQRPEGNTVGNFGSGGFTMPLPQNQQNLHSTQQFGRLSLDSAPLSSRPFEQRMPSSSISSSTASNLSASQQLAKNVNPMDLAFADLVDIKASKASILGSKKL